MRILGSTGRKKLAAELLEEHLTAALHHSPSRSFLFQDKGVHCQKYFSSPAQLLFLRSTPPGDYVSQSFPAPADCLPEQIQ